MESRKEGSSSQDQRTSCLENNRNQIKPNLRSNTCSQKRSPIIFRSGCSVSRSAYPVQRGLNCSDLGAKTTKKRMHCINMNVKHLHALQKLYLGLGSKATAMNFHEIAETLKKPASLQSLTLTCIECYALTDKAFCYLSNGLKRLPGLKSLDLGFHFRNYNEQITDKRLNYLNQSLKKLKYLEEVKLTFDFCPAITDLGVSGLIANLENLGLLQSLTFSFAGGVDLTERAFLDLCNALKKLPCLKTLNLHLRSSKRVITDNVLKRLGEALERLASLRNLDLDLEIHEETTDLGLQKLFTGLSKLVELQNLRLNIVGGWNSRGLGDQGLLDLSEALKRLVHLRTLNICFLCQEHNFTDQGLSHIGKGIAHLKLLEEISLKFADTEKITDQGLEMLGQGLKGLVVLQRIRLDLYRLFSITDSAGQKFCKSLEKLPSLKEFELQVEVCPTFTGAGLYKMCKVLKDIPSLQTVRYKIGEKFGFVSGKEKIIQAMENPAIYFPNLPNNFGPKSNTCSIF